MFEFLRKEEPSQVAERASRHWTDNLSSPYKLVYNGNISFKLESTPVLSENQAIIFKKSLETNITKALSGNGYIQIKQNSPLIEKALSDADAVIPCDRQSEDIMFIEDGTDLFFYSPGMNRAKKLGK